MEFQAVRVSENHPTVHAASSQITEDTKRFCQVVCGTILRENSLIKLSQPVTCTRCLRYLSRRGIRL